MGMFDTALEDIVIKINDEDDEEKGKDKEKTKKVDSDSIKAFKSALTEAGIDPADVGKVMAALKALEAEKAKASKAEDAEEKDEDEEKGKKAKAAKAKAKAQDDEEEEDGKRPNPFDKKKAQKSDGVILKMMDDGSIVVSGDVAKARKKDDDDVEKALQLFGVTATMLKDADSEVFEKALEALAKGDLPKDPGFESQVRPTKPDVAKSAQDLDMTHKVVKAIESLGGRLERIEKSRKGSSSLEGEGGTDDETPVKKDFWNGVLHS